VAVVQELRKLKQLLQERELLLSNLSKSEHELVEVSPKRSH
jgi:hypothetical protein